MYKVVARQLINCRKTIVHKKRGLQRPIVNVSLPLKREKQLKRKENETKICFPVRAFMRNSRLGQSTNHDKWESGNNRRGDRKLVTPAAY